MGEPSGAGADILLKAWSEIASNLPPIVVLDDPNRLEAAAHHLGIDLTIVTVQSPADALNIQKTDLPVWPLEHSVPYAPGHPTPDTAPAVIEALDRAVDAATTQDVAGIVTLPIQKDILYAAGFAYPGHTEYLAARSGAPCGVMMLAVEGLRVIPVTIHEPLHSVSQMLTSDMIIQTADTALKDLKHKFSIEAPRLVVAGLNPHAGENGTIGQEEIDYIVPAVKELQTRGWSVTGPFPADSLFHADARSTFDAALCMYHDQALIPLKTLDFWGGVNVTLGLPFIRTSPDHGTATAIAGKGIARTDSFTAAVNMAWQMHLNSALQDTPTTQVI